MAAIVPAGIHEVENAEVLQGGILVFPALEDVAEGLHIAEGEAGDGFLFGGNAGIDIGGGPADDGQIGRLHAFGFIIKVEACCQGVLIHQIQQHLSGGVGPGGELLSAVGHGGGAEARGRRDTVSVLHNTQTLAIQAEEHRGLPGHLNGDVVGFGGAVLGGDHHRHLIFPAPERHFSVTLHRGLGVRGGGGEGDLIRSQRQGEGVVRDGRIKGGGQLTGADGEGGEGVVAALARGAGGVVRLAVVGGGGGDDGHRGAAGGIIVLAGHAVGAGGDPHGAGAGVIGPEHELVGAVIPLKAHGGQVAGLQCEVSGIGHGIGPRLRPGRHGDGKGHGTAHADGALPGGHRHSRSIAHLQEGEKHGAQQRKAHKVFFQ